MSLTGHEPCFSIVQSECNQCDGLLASSPSSCLLRRRATPACPCLRLRFLRRGPSVALSLTWSDWPTLPQHPEHAIPHYPQCRPLSTDRQQSIMPPTFPTASPDRLCRAPCLANPICRFHLSCNFTHASGLMNREASDTERPRGSLSDTPIDSLTGRDADHPQP